MPEIRTHTDVVVTAIATKVYEGKGPSDPHGNVPYSVVYGGSNTSDGPMSSPWSDWAPEVQVTAVGNTSEQAEWEADRVYNALVGAALSPPAGRAWQRPGAPIGHILTRPVERDDDVGLGGSLFYVAAIFDLPTTPA